jgi:hypothetical protein
VTKTNLQARGAFWARMQQTAVVSNPEEERKEAR